MLVIGVVAAVVSPLTLDKTELATRNESIRDEHDDVDEDDTACPTLLGIRLRGLEKGEEKANAKECFEVCIAHAEDARKRIHVGLVSRSSRPPGYNIGRGDSDSG